MKNKVPNNYFNNLANYEDFLLRKTLLGFNLTPRYLSKVFKHFDTNIWCLFTTEGIEYIDEKCNKINDNVFAENLNYSCRKDLISLKGVQHKVTEDFYCGYCQNLTSLEGAPQEVGEDFDCSLCKNLTSLEGAPQKVGGNFNCSFCFNLTSLEGAPQEVGGDFVCLYCESLTSLEGAPIKVKEKCYIFDCDKLSKKQIDAYLEFLKNPTPEHIDSTGHYKP